jgi:hypothetical protein
MALDPRARIILLQTAEIGDQPVNELSVDDARQASAPLAAMQDLPETCPRQIDTEIGSAASSVVQVDCD